MNWDQVSENYETWTPALRTDFHVLAASFDFKTRVCDEAVSEGCNLMILFRSPCFSCSHLRATVACVCVWVRERVFTLRKCFPPGEPICCLVESINIPSLQSKFVFPWYLSTNDDYSHFKNPKLSKRTRPTFILSFATRRFWTSLKSA